MRDVAHDLTNNVLTGFASPDLQVRLDAITEADAVVVATPVYAASYSGLFKMLIDVLPKDALRDTPVLLGATGGTARHSLAIDHALRPLFAHLGALVAPVAVFAASEDWGSVDAGRLGERIERAGRAFAGLVSGSAARRAGRPLRGRHALRVDADRLPAADRRTDHTSGRAQHRQAARHEQFACTSGPRPPARPRRRGRHRARLDDRRRRVRAPSAPAAAAAGSRAAHRPRPSPPSWRTATPPPRRSWPPLPGVRRHLRLRPRAARPVLGLPRRLGLRRRQDRQLRGDGPRPSAPTPCPPAWQRPVAVARRRRRSPPSTTAASRQTARLTRVIVAVVLAALGRRRRRRARRRGRRRATGSAASAPAASYGVLQVGRAAVLRLRRLRPHRHPRRGGRRPGAHDPAGDPLALGDHARRLRRRRASRALLAARTRARWRRRGAAGRRRARRRPRTGPCRCVARRRPRRPRSARCSR